MRVRRFWYTMLPLAAGFATVACQSAQRPAALLSPAQATPPPLVAAAASPPAQAHNSSSPNALPAPAQSPAPNPPKQRALSADPVADLIAQVEVEYQAGQENYRAGHLE